METDLLRKINSVLVGLNAKINNPENADAHKLPTEYDCDGFVAYRVEDDLYVKINFYADSYGNIDGATSVELVKPKVVQITEFEEI